GDELIAPTLHELGDAVEDLAAVHRGLVGPRLECLARGPDSLAQVLSGGADGVGDRVAAGRLDNVRAAALGARERAPDVELVRLADVDPVGCHQRAAPVGAGFEQIPTRVVSGAARRPNRARPAASGSECAA